MYLENHLGSNRRSFDVGLCLGTIDGGKRVFQSIRNPSHRLNVALSMSARRVTTAGSIDSSVEALVSTQERGAWIKPGDVIVSVTSQPFPHISLRLDFRI
ncbi:hypothetical protein [Paraburkholderia solisilvae]|uniref:hypothetical protein n=1 Tax=Paraburkholderia solisilvae TaxID=624376 RepID=UPI0015838C3F|nr:hypothetical protein [Paraburkholderia solisilvae]